MEFKHKPVMLNECIEGLNINKNGIYVDGTLGGAGHSKEIAKRLSEKGILIGIDRDEEALAAAKETLKQFQNVKYVHGNHDDIKEIYDVVGPICESSDVFAKNYTMSKCEKGDLVIIRSAGAYGESMASRYNYRDIPKAYLDTDL